MYRRRRRIQRYFRAAIAATLATLLAVSLVALRSVDSSHRSGLAVAHANLAALSDATELQGLLYQKGMVARYFLTGDPRWLEDLRAARPAFERWLAQVAQESRSPESGRVAASLREEYAAWDKERSESIALYQAGRLDEVLRPLREPGFVDHSARLRELSTQLLEVRRREIQAEVERAEVAWRSALLTLAAALLLAILGATAITGLAARWIARPLYELVLRAQTAAGGARVEVNASDEIGYISEHVQRLAQRIESSSAELAEHRLRLSQAEKMSALGEMATAVAHEVLNPLTGVKTAVQLLARSHPTSAVVETAAAVDAEIRRVEGMARRLVAFARPLQPMVDSCRLADLVGQARAATRHEVDSRGLRLETDLDAFPSVDGDPDLLVQVLVNLISNACQAYPASETHGTVRIRARREASWKVIEVRDQGTGISPAVQGRLFTPFVTTRRDGHGLGLAVSQNIAIAHGGRIEARSDPLGPGAIFALWLPDPGAGAAHPAPEHAAGATRPLLPATAHR